MQKIPFYKPCLGEAEINEVVHTLRSGWLTTGPKTKQFEKEFAEFSGHKHAVAVNSCTAALHLALEAIGVKAGEGILVPTMTFAATAEVVRYFGAMPILVDCRESDFNLDVIDAERRLKGALARNQTVKAIMPVHYGGQIGDVMAVADLASRYSLRIVEDAAHCCPAFYREGPRDYGTTGLRDHGTTGPQDYGTTGPQDYGTTGPRDHRRTDAPTTDAPPPAPWLPVGTSADISCYSFYANKCITTGEGGMACTHSDDYADRMRIMSLHGISKDAWKRFTAAGSWYYEIIAPGFKYNMTDIAAAIGIHQLRKANELHRRRACLAELYSSLLGDVDELILPRQLPDRIHSWHLYAIRLRLDRLSIDRGQFIKELQERGIGISVHWMPLHMHPYYRETYGYAPGDLPVASSLYHEIITLPLYPDMTECDVHYVCDSIRAILSTRSSRREEAHSRVPGVDQGTKGPKD